MKRLIPIALVVILTQYSLAQKRDYLFGVVTRDSLLKPQHASWFMSGYENYKPDDLVLDKLKKLSLKDYSFEIFFGSWCGDTRRDLPRFFKIADKLGVSATNIKLIAVGLDDQYKQAPGGENKDRGIYRVATFVVLKQGREINRITEHAVISLEQDLLDILTGNSYTSNYQAYPQINTWLRNGLLLNPNISTRGLAKQIGTKVFTPSELNSCAHVLLVQGKIQEAVAVYRMNAFLFYDNVDAYSGLAEALSKLGSHKEAIETMEYAFTLNEDKAYIKSLLESYFTIKKEANGKP